MKAEFSAFFYGVALLNEISNAVSPHLVAGLFLPRLEGPRAEAGFPPIGWPLFLDFRLAEYMLTPRATGWVEHEQRFFRLAIPPRSCLEQHDLLRCFSAEEPEVYYVAPAFYRQEEFARVLTSGQLLQSSRFIPVNSLPEAGESRTLYITYGKDEPGVRWFMLEQESRQLDISIEACDWLAHVQELLRKPRQMGWRFGLELRQSLLRCLRESTRQPRLFEEPIVDLDTVIPSTVLRDLQYLLQGHFGLQALLVHPA